MKISEIKTLLQANYTSFNKELVEEKTTKDKYVKYVEEHCPSKYVLSVNFIEDRVGKLAYYCQKCHSFEVTTLCRTSCSHCGNKNIMDARYNNNQYISLIVPLTVNEEYCILASIQTTLFFTPADTASDLKESLKRASLKVSIESANPTMIFFSFSQGLKELVYDKWTMKYSLKSLPLNTILGDKEKTLYYKNSSYDKLLEMLSEKISFSPDVPLATVIDALQEDIEKARSKKTAAKTTTKKKSKEAIIKELMGLSLPDLTSKIEESMKNVDFMSCITLSSTPMYKEIVGVCPCCHTEVKTRIDKQDEEKQQITCPTCKRAYNFYASPYSSTWGSHLYKNASYWSFVDGYILVRCFRITQSLKEDETTSSFKLETEIEECNRAFMDEKNTYFFSYRSYTRKWTNIPATSYPERVFTDDLNLQTKEELAEIIKKSYAKYSGVLDAWGLGLNKKLKIEEPGSFGRLGYLYSWQKKHYLELLLKAGFKDIASHIINYKKMAEDIPNPKGTSVLDVLNINRPELHIAQKDNASLSQIANIRNLWETDNSMSYEDYLFMKETQREDLFVAIKKNYNIPFSKQIEYVRSCFDFQCITNNDAITLWSDYLGFAKSIGYNLKNKNAKYPASLKREHDIALFVKNSIQGGSNKCDIKAFKEKAKENSKFDYSLKSLGLEVFTPQSPEEVINEGMELHHCVSHYVNAIIEGRSIVMFIRKDDDRETPYYTAEIIADGTSAKITQVKGNMNSDPDSSTPEGKKILDFVSKWAKFKKLDISI